MLNICQAREGDYLAAWIDFLGTATPGSGIDVAGIGPVGELAHPERGQRSGPGRGGAASTSVELLGC